MLSVRPSAGASQDLVRGEAGRDDDRVEHIDAEPLFLDDDVVGALEARDDRIEENGGAERREDRKRKAAGRRENDRSDGHRQIEVDRRRPAIDRVIERGVENLDDLMLLDLPGM